MTISESIISWLMLFNPEDYWRMNKINTDIMHNDVDYSLVKEPVRNVRTFISGTQIITEHYQFRARLSAFNDIEAVENGKWLEALTEWISEKNQKKEFPNINIGIVQEIGISSPFFIGKSDDKNAIYQLTIFIRYRKENI